MTQLVLYDAAAAIGQLLRGAPDGRDYRISTMYVEFENGTSGAIATPTLADRAAGLAYYTALAGETDRDYLRVPVIRTSFESSDEELYPLGNIATFAAHASAGVGVNGKTFDVSAGSRIYGCALVASPNPDVLSDDIVVARIYYDSAGDQLALPASTGISVEGRWQLT